MLSNVLRTATKYRVCVAFVLKVMQHFWALHGLATFTYDFWQVARMWYLENGMTICSTVKAHYMPWLCVWSLVTLTFNLKSPSSLTCDMGHLPINIGFRELLFPRHGSWGDRHGLSAICNAPAVEELHENAVLTADFWNTLLFYLRNLHTNSEDDDEAPVCCSITWCTEHKWLKAGMHYLSSI